MEARSPGAAVISCRRCGADVPSENVNLVNRLAKCRLCQAVFSFVDQLEGQASAPPPMERPLPAGIQVEEQGNLLCIVRRWYNHALFFMLFFCVLWDGFLVVWYASFGVMDGGGPTLLFYLFPVFHVIVGVSLTYSTIAGFFNRTEILATPGLLSIRHAPLPWFGNRDLLVENIEQLFCKETVSRGKNGPNYSYSLEAVMRDGRAVRLLKGNSLSVEQVLFLEHAIERHLGIVNRPVPGEMKR